MTIITPRGNSTIETAKFIGQDKEITIDTTRHTVVVHDGVKAGGYQMMGLTNVPTATTSAGSVGQFAYQAGAFYVCTTTGWQKATLTNVTT